MWIFSRGKDRGLNEWERVQTWTCSRGRVAGSALPLYGTVA